MPKQNKPTIAITMGDPCGIGPEIIIKSIIGGKLESLCNIVVLGDPGVFEENIKTLGADLDIVEVRDTKELSASSTKLYILPVCLERRFSISWGKATSDGGRLSKLAIDKAVELATNGSVDAITTAPINKKAVNMAGLKFSGHTEYLAELTGSDKYAMMLVGGGLRVVVVTTHLAVKDVPDMIKRQRVFDKISIAHESGLFFGLNKPRLAVCALNPHAGDGGVFGTEEADEILPAIKQAVDMGIDADGPLVADTLFTKEHLVNYDIVVAMYHDQGLIPLKMNSFGHGVNITLGLPIIRTSVDHGTAYNIAGLSLADPGSLHSALTVAVDAHKYKTKKQ